MTIGLGESETIHSFDPFIFYPCELRGRSKVAKSTDRTLLSVDASRELDKSIEEFLLKYLMEASSSSIFEWLVRRFR